MPARGGTSSRDHLLPGDGQVPQHVSHVLIALVARLGQRPLDHRDEVLWKARIEVRE